MHVVGAATRPGLFASLGYAESLRHLDRFERTTGIGIPVPVIATLAVERSPYLGPRGGTFIQKIRDFFSSARVIDEVSAPIDVAAAEVHCPAVVGASAKVTIGTTETTSKSTFAMFAIGGSLEHELQVEESLSLEIEDGACVEIVYRFPAVWERCEVADADGQWKQFTRLKSIPNPEPQHIAVRLEDRDDCLAAQHRAGDVTFDLRALTKGHAVRTLKTAEDVKWSGKAKIATPGMELGGEYAAKRSTSLAWEYKLPGGHAYAAWRGSGAPGWIWRSTK